RWASATTAKITPATRENVFASMARHPRFRTQDSTPRGGGCERGANDLVTKMVTNGAPRTGMERHELARPATFPKTKSTLTGIEQIGSGRFRSNLHPAGRTPSWFRVLLPHRARTAHKSVLSRR